jgi:hypothetical protein
MVGDADGVSVKNRRRAANGSIDPLSEEIPV